MRPQLNASSVSWTVQPPVMTGRPQLILNSAPSSASCTSGWYRVETGTLEFNRLSIGVRTKWIFGTDKYHQWIFMYIVH